MQHILSYIFLMPLAASFLLLLVPTTYKKVFRFTTTCVFFLQLVLIFILLVQFDKSLPNDLSSAFQFVERADWITIVFGQLGVFQVTYAIGIDGISLSLIALSSLILLIGSIASWNINEHVKGYFVFYLILASSIIGSFIALDLFLFYLCFEFMIIPMFFLIGIWGGDRKSYASVKFLLYTIIGSLFLLVVLIGLYLSVQEEGEHTFSLISMLQGKYSVGSILDPCQNYLIFGVSARSLAFLFLLIGFGIKLATVPLHMWLPDVHVEAPTPISVILAGLLLKVGVYGLFRIGYCIFPDMANEYAVWVGSLGVLSILYGALNALAQNDLKRMIAYSSISHIGFALLGLSSLMPIGVLGAIFHIISHGLISPALFLLVEVITKRTGTRKIENFSGLAGKLPLYTFFVGFFFFAGLGMPGLSGFVGELMVLLGVFHTSMFLKWMGCAAILGILLAAGYFLWTFQRMFLGKFFIKMKKEQFILKDLTFYEIVCLTPLAFLVLLLGIYPNVLLDFFTHTVQLFILLVQ